MRSGGCHPHGMRRRRRRTNFQRFTRRHEFASCRLDACLPPFDALVAFEAVCCDTQRDLAAAELARTQSAVSHRLRRLEAFVGTPLLRRLHPVSNQLGRTGHGRRLRGGSRWDGELRTRCRAATGPERLQVGVGSAVAQYWLVRRLPAFMEAHPDTDVELVLLPNCDAVRAASLDVRLLWLPIHGGSGEQHSMFAPA